MVTSAHGDLCPVAALTADPDTRVLLSSGVAWWKEEDWEVRVFNSACFEIRSVIYITLEGSEG